MPPRSSSAPTASAAPAPLAPAAVQRRWSGAGDDGRVLVTDGHTRQALAIVRSLGQAGYDVWVASHYRRPIAAWSRHCRGWFHLPAEDTRAYGALRAWAARRHIGIVLPLTEAACSLCNAHRERWEAAGCTLGCGPDAMLLQAFDKGRTFEIAARCALPVPETWAPVTLEGYHAAAQVAGYPCVVKPRFSNARHGDTVLPDLGVAYVDGPAALEEAVLARRQGEHWPLLQTWVAGTGRGVFALCDHGTPVAWFAHQRLRDVRPTGSGSSLRRSVPLDPTLRAGAERLLRAMAWHGPVMLEFRDDGVHPPRLMEVNGRFWGSLQLAIASGVDFPLLWVRLLRGEAVSPTESFRAGVTLRWWWGDMKRLGYILHGRPAGFTGTFPSAWQGLRELFGRQPPGTKLEAWDRGDPWPAVGEFLQGIREVLAWRRQRTATPEESR